MAKKTSWAVIILGISAFVLVVGVVMVGVVGYVIYQQFAFQGEVRHRDERRRGVRGDRGEVRRPETLIIKDGQPVLNDAPAAAPGQRVEALHVIVWDPDKRKVVKLNMPFWLLRMTKGKPIRLSSNDDADGGAVTLKITAEDLERRGPGLILDHKEASGERVLVWAQ